MKALFAALWTEGLKARRSKIFWITLLFFSFIGIVMGLLVFLAKHPDISGNSAIINAKAAIIGNADWAGFFGLLHMVISMIGLIGFGFVTSWIFGREYSDRTVNDLLALPVSRFYIVSSKFIIITLWCIILSLVLFLLGLLTGFLVNIEGWSGKMALNSFFLFTVTSLLTIILSTPIAFLASCSRGFLLPLGFLILALIISQVIGVVLPGVAPYFPWSIPTLYGADQSVTGQEPGVISYMILLFTGSYALEQ